MKKPKIAVSGILAGCAMLVIILDGKTALHSMQEGLQLCIQTVIPSLFPIFVLSGILSSSLLGESFGLLRYLGRLCKIPKGGESLLTVGFLSGYPVGAQLVTQAYKTDCLPLDTARRMLGFCNNAGPAFLFGMLCPMFDNSLVPWIIWGIHIVGALITGWILPGNSQMDCILQKDKPTTLPAALHNALRNMAAVCGWVLIFRVILGFCSMWFLWLFPTEVQVLLSGMLELSNGCIMLHRLPQEGLRFIFASFMLSFGGLCVMMQTRSVTAELGFGCYFPGKTLQTLITTTLSVILQPVIFSEENVLHIPTALYGMLIIFAIIIIYLVKTKKL